MLEVEIREINLMEVRPPIMDGKAIKHPLIFMIQKMMGS